jgi:hypothetical protein
VTGRPDRPESTPAERVQRWLEALEARHLANLTRSEAARALRALSSCYVERRAKLGAALEGTGKRAAFALYYGPLHFSTIDAIVRRSDLASRAVRTIHDLGCGIGVGGAAWAMACAGAPRVLAADRNAWAVAEANWTYREIGISGRATRGDVASPRFRLATREGDAIVLAYVVNELSEADCAIVLDRVAVAASQGCSVLVVEPIARRLGHERWWPDWTTRLAAFGCREDEWRFPAALPDIARDLGRAAGLDPHALTARTLLIAPR